MIKKIIDLNEALVFIKNTYNTTIYFEDSIVGQKNFINNYVYGKDTYEMFNNIEEYYGYYMDELVGVISLRNDGYIKFLFVNKNNQGQGIGKKLMNYIEMLAKTRNIKALVLDSSLSNEAFYEKIGFKRTSDQVCMDQIWFIPMKKEI